MNINTLFRRRRTKLSILVTWLVAAAACIGCAPVESTAPVVTKEEPRLRILRNGVPLRPAGGKLPPGDSGIRVVLIKLDGADSGRQISPILLAEQPGAFELKGQDGRPITPGRYRVAISLGSEGGSDQLQGKYTPENSTIEVEVKEGEDLIVDLAKHP